MLHIYTDNAQDSNFGTYSYTVLLIFLYHLLNKTDRNISQHYKNITQLSIFEEFVFRGFLALHVTFIEFVDFDYIPL